MANNCVNIKSREFKKLVVDTSLHPVVLSGKVSLWQDKNGVENYPTKEDIIDSFSDENVMFNIPDNPIKKLSKAEKLKNLTETFSIGTTGYFGKMLMVDIIKPKLKELGYTLKPTSNANGYYIVNDKGRRYIPAKKIKYTAPKWFKAPDYSKPAVKETPKVNKDLFGNDVMFQLDNKVNYTISENKSSYILEEEGAEYFIMRIDKFEDVNNGVLYLDDISTPTLYSLGLLTKKTFNYSTGNKIIITSAIYKSKSPIKALAKVTEFLASKNINTLSYNFNDYVKNKPIIDNIYKSFINNTKVNKTLQEVLRDRNTTSETSDYLNGLIQEIQDNLVDKLGVSLSLVEVIPFINISYENDKLFLNVNLEKLQVLFNKSNTFFQKESTEQPVDPKIDDAMTRLISELGIDLINYNEYAEYYEQKEGKKLTAVAVADMFNKVIAVKEGHADKSTLAHEVGHFIEFALHNDKRIMFAIENVHLTELWQQKSEQYMQEYNNDENKVRREIVGQLIGLSLSDNVKNEKPSWKRLMLQVWNKFLDFFTFGSKAKTTRIRNSIDAIAKETLKDSSNVKKGLESQVSNKNNVLFELDPKDFKNSRILEGELKTLKSALSIIVNKINVYKKAGTEEITTTERDLRDVLSKAIRDVDDRDVDDYNKNYVTMGLINFIARMEEEAQFIIERVDIIEEAIQDGVYNNELDQLSKLLKQMNDYMLVYEPLLEDLMPTVKKLKRNSTEDVELYDKILKAFDTIDTGIKTMKKDYVKHTKFILMSVAKDIFNGMENLANNPVKLKRELDLFEAQLSEKVGDLSFAQTYIDAAGTSHDAVIKLIDRLYKETKEDTNKEVLDINRDIIDLHENFVEAGGRTTKFMAELDKDGNVTGNIVGEYNEAQFNEAKKVFTSKLDKEYGLPEANTRDEYITRDKKWYALTESQRSSYWGAVEVWETNNTETSPKLKELLNTKYNNIIKSIIPLKHDRDILYALLDKYPNNKTDHRVDKKMMDELKESNKALYNNFTKVRLTFREWRSKREYADFAGNITYKKELAIPKLSIYGNKQYTAIMSNPTEKKYYEGMMKIRKDLLKSLPEEIVNSMLMVQIRKDFIERIKTDPKRTMQESYKDAVEKRETDYDYGVKTFNEDKTQMKHIPILHYRKLDNMKDLSLDFTAGMMILADMAINYKNNNKVINIVNITSDVLKVRKVFKATTGIEGGINKITDKFMLNNTTALETVGGRGHLRFQEYINTVFYNELKDDDQGTTFGFDTSKLADALIKYTAMNSLALNIYAGFNNVMLGNIMLREEAFVKEYIKHKDLLFATKTYWRELPSLMIDMLKLRSNNKMRLVFEELDVFQDHGQRIQEVNADRTNFGRMFSLSNMFIINKGGEHQIQGRLALGMMSNLKLKDKNGNEINFYDAYEVDNYRLKLMEGLTKENGKPFTEKDIKSFKIKLKKVNNDLHGIYNLTDRALIQKYWQGRAAMLFRKWLRPGWNRRFQSHDYDFSLDKDIEGMYVTSTKFVVSLYKELQAAKLTFATAGEAYDKLEDWQKANIKRNIAEVGYFVALMVAGTLLASIAGDDDDDWLLNMTAYQANRLSTEIGFFVPGYNATQITTLIQSPSATINQIDKIMDLVKVIDPFIIGNNDPFLREYQSGRHKGQTRLKIWSKRTIPMWDSVDSWFYPEEKLKFFTN